MYCKERKGIFRWAFKRCFYICRKLLNGLIILLAFDVCSSPGVFCNTAAIRQPIWTGFRVASGCLCEASSNRHSCLSVPGCSKGGKFWTEKGVVKVLPFPLQQFRTTAPAVWMAGVRDPGATPPPLEVAIHSKDSYFQAQNAQGLECWDTSGCSILGCSFWPTAGVLWWHPSDCSQRQNKNKII